MKSVWFKNIVWGLLLIPMLAVAKEYKAGTHYTQLAVPVATESGDKIEVLEFFWYGCPHCFKFEPTINKWKKTLPENVYFVRVPAPLNPKWMVQTKTFYALELMGKIDQFHDLIFDGMHVKRKKLFTQEAMTQFLAENGIDAKAFTDAYNSFAVEMRARKAMQLGLSYKLGGVPMLTVNGKYVISASEAGSFEEMVNIANYLIAKEAKAAK